jgi:hypothetical protein
MAKGSCLCGWVGVPVSQVVFETASTTPVLVYKLDTLGGGLWTLAQTLTPAAAGVRAVAMSRRVLALGTPDADSEDEQGLPAAGRVTVWRRAAEADAFVMDAVLVRCVRVCVCACVRVGVCVWVWGCGWGAWGLWMVPCHTTVHGATMLPWAVCFRASVHRAHVGPRGQPATHPRSERTRACTLRAPCVCCQVHPPEYPVEAFASLGLAVACMGDGAVAASTRAGGGGFPSPGRGAVLVWRLDGGGGWAFTQALHDGTPFYGSALAAAAPPWVASVPGATGLPGAVLAVGSPALTSAYTLWPLATGDGVGTDAARAAGVAHVWVDTALSLAPVRALGVPAPSPGQRGHLWASVSGDTDAAAAAAAGVVCPGAPDGAAVHVFAGGDVRGVQLAVLDLPAGGTLTLALAYCDTPGAFPGALLQLWGAEVPGPGAVPGPATLLHTFPLGTHAGVVVEAVVGLPPPAAGSSSLLQLSLVQDPTGPAFVVTACGVGRTGLPALPTALSPLAPLPATSLTDTHGDRAVPAGHGSSVAAATDAATGDVVVLVGGALLLTDAGAVQGAALAWALPSGSRVLAGPVPAPLQAGNVGSQRTVYGLRRSADLAVFTAWFPGPEAGPGGQPASGAVAVAVPAAAGDALGVDVAAVVPAPGGVTPT